MAVTAYRPRSPEHAVLHGVVRDHLADFLGAATDDPCGHGLPGFVEREFREFPGGGVLGWGFAPVRCGDCAFERLVAFSCKGRGFMLPMSSSARSTPTAS